MPPNHQAFLPLKPIDLEVLLALADEERHGYGIVQHIFEHSQGLIALDPGNLYRVIKRLLAEGLLVEAAHRHADDLNGERRRYYRLTPVGQRVLGAELERLHALVTSRHVRTLARRLGAVT